MSDYIKHKEYKLPNGRTVTADFNELGEARATIEAMDYLMDMINSLVEVVRCQECKRFDTGYCGIPFIGKKVNPNDYCSYGEKRDD